MSKLIEFDEQGYKNAVETLEEIVNGINRAIPILADKEEVTLELIREMRIPIYVNKTRFTQEMQRLCDEYGQKFDEVASLFTADHFIKDLANKNVQYLFEARRELKVHHKSFLFLYTDDYITINEGVAELAPKAKELLKAKHSYYTETSNEDEILGKIIKVNKLLNELGKKYGHNNVKNISVYCPIEKQFTVWKPSLKDAANQKR